MTREEFDKQINSNISELGKFVLCYQFIDSIEQQNTALKQERANMQTTHRNTIVKLEARIKELEYEKQLQYNTDQMCQTISAKKIEALEQRIKELE